MNILKKCKNYIKIKTSIEFTTNYVAKIMKVVHIKVCLINLIISKILNECIFKSIIRI